MKRVIIESPYAGSIELNVRYARECLKDSLERGEAPIASHLLHTQVLDDNIPSERESGIAWGIDILNGCDELWVCSENISDGMKREIEYARTQGIPIINKVRS